MYKIFLTVRNRLAITKKCITALENHSRYPRQIYIYDNSTDYLIREHFMYYALLYEKNIVSQITFTSKESTFSSFSKAATCNLFGLQHEQDPNKNNYDFILILDNDAIVHPDWDVKIMDAWKEVKNKNLNNIKIITEYPSGMSSCSLVPSGISGNKAYVGYNGGSAFWAVKPNFFSEIGLLNLNQLINIPKKHDQFYWKKLVKVVKGPYILGLTDEVYTHCGGMAGSVCNTLYKNINANDKEKSNLIKFESSEKTIDDMTFDDFYKHIKNRRKNN